jgi:hypothetical protein
MAYDAAKAAEYNKLIQQGLSPAAAAAQAGISESDGNYEIDENGTPATNSNFGKIIKAGSIAASQRLPQPPSPTAQQLADDAETNRELSGLPTTISTVPTASRTTIQRVEVTESTTTTTTSGGGSVTRYGGSLPTQSSDAYSAQASAAQLELDQFNQNNPGPLARRRQGLPPLTLEENQTRLAQQAALSDQVNQNLTLSQSARQPISSGESFVPDTTTTEVTSTGAITAYRSTVNTNTDQVLSEQAQVRYETTNVQTANATSATNTQLSPASDPSQFPAYDDDGNLQPGFAINDENGGTYYRGFPSQDVGTALPVSDPYYGLTSTQLQDLGGADPTDPYIRARLGIPQLPGSTLFATGGFGTIKTGVPAIDSALGIIGGGITSLFSNFSSTIGGLFGPKPTASAAAATTGSGVAALTVPVTSPSTTQSSVNPASDPSQFPAYDDDGNLQPGFAINDETGDTYYQGFRSQDVTNRPVNPASDPSQFPAYDDDGNLQPGFAINDETGDTYYQGFRSQDVINRPVNPASDPSQFPAYDDDGNLQPGFAINDETGDTYYQGFRSQDVTNRPVNPASDPSQFPAYDDEGNLQPGFAINDETGDTYYQGFERNTDQPFQADLDPEYSYYSVAGLTQPEVDNPANVNDPYYGLTSQQLQDLGGADPTDPYIRARLGIPQLPGSTLAATPGFGTIKTGVPIIDNALNFIGGLFGSKPAAPPTPAAPPVSPTSDPSQFPAYDDDGNLQPGFAINPETGETYYQGFEKNTDQPVNPASDPSQFPAYDDDGNLQPGFAINDETGDTYYQGLGPATQQSSVNPASDPSQFPAYDDDGNLQPGFAVNDETGDTYYQGFPQPANNDAVALDANSGYGSEVGSAPLDVAEVAGLSRDATTVRATNPDLSPEAQANLDGINAANAEIVQAQGNIQSNNLNILRAEEGVADARENQRQSEAIIAQNNAELADPSITDERRAELLANNAEQEASIAENARYIDDTTQYIEEVEDNNAQQQDNILTNQVIAEENAAGFRANNGGELLTVEPNLDPELEQADEEVTVDTTDPTEVAALVDPGLETPVDQEVLTTDNATEVDPDEDAELQEPPDADSVAAELAEPVDPDADPELLGGPEDEVDPFAPLEEPPDVDAEESPELLGGPEDEVDPFEPLEEPPDVDAEESPELLGGPEEEVDPFAPLEEPPDVDAEESPELLGGPGDEEPGEPELLGGPEDVDTNEDDGLKTPDGQEEAGGAADTGLREPTDADVEQANQENAMRDRAQQQATFQARYKQPGNADWRVRLSLAPDSQYLYNEKSGVGILAPLAATDGVIFPYTPNITTTYSANYEQYDLVHSNYRGLFYKNSRVGDIQVRGTFTAQDTKEADYLLAVIHFFRSATKMFYGATDPQRGTPPPVCLLNGFGQYQFSDHPVVISSFNYTLPNDVDYIRAGSPNNYGLNLLNRRAAIASNPGGQSLAGLNRLTNALLKKGAPGQGVPDPSAIQQNVSNTAGASYVPTKMEIDITLIPVQTRTQVSKQFNLKGFANGQLLKGGFW